MQFNIDKHNIFKSDPHAKGGGILMYVRDDIPCKLIPMRNSTTKGFFIELKLRKRSGFCAATITLSKDLFPTI